MPWTQAFLAPVDMAAMPSGLLPHFVLEAGPASIAFLQCSWPFMLSDPPAGRSVPREMETHFVILRPPGTLSACNSPLNTKMRICLYVSGLCDKLR